MRISQQLLDEILVDISEFVKKLIKSSDSISDLFYGKVNEEIFQVFSQYLEGVMNLIQTLTMTAEDAKEHNHPIHTSLDQSIHQLIHKCNEIEKALNNKDFVQIGDIIKYDLTEILENIDNDLRGINK